MKHCSTLLRYIISVKRYQSTPYEASGCFASQLLYVIGNAVAIRRIMLETYPELCPYKASKGAMPPPVTAAVVARSPLVIFHAGQHQSGHTQGSVVHASVAVAPGGEHGPSPDNGLLVIHINHKTCRGQTTTFKL